MSTRYYLSNRQKRKEFEAFNVFWKEKFIPGLKNQINNYCMEVNGEYVNKGFAEAMIDETVAQIIYTPGDSTNYETEVCSTRWNGNRTLCQWEGVAVDGWVIRDEISLTEFFAKNSNQGQYCIVDEYDMEYSLNDFLQKIKSGNEVNK